LIAMNKTDWQDPEQDLHVCELKVRLLPADRALLVALARKLDLPPAVLARKFVRDGLTGPRLVPVSEKRRPA
jgi:hypothetical protein